VTADSIANLTAGRPPAQVSVVIPSHNPPQGPFARVLGALRAQSLPLDQWELIVVDDGSRESLAETLDLSWHPRGSVIATGTPGKGHGLVAARLKGFDSGTADVFVFVDQDNALDEQYLAGALEISREYPRLGSWGGQVTLEFDDPARAPEPWLWPLLCTRKLSGDIWSNDIHHYESTPWGAGLCVRRLVLNAHRAKVEANPLRRQLDPTPTRMGFGGDTDLVNTGCGLGYGKGVFKRLHLGHLIPAGRCTDEYFLRSAEARGFSTVLHGFLDEGVAKPPRGDLRFWVYTALRWPLMKPLERRMLLRTRRGQFAAVREFSARPARATALPES